MELSGGKKKQNFSKIFKKLLLKLLPSAEEATRSSGCYLLKLSQIIASTEGRSPKGGVLAKKNMAQSLQHQVLLCWETLPRAAEASLTRSEVNRIERFKWLETVSFLSLYRPRHLWNEDNFEFLNTVVTRRKNNDSLPGDPIGLEAQETIETLSCQPFDFLCPQRG